MRCIFRKVFSLVALVVAISFAGATEGQAETDSLYFSLSGNMAIPTGDNADYVHVGGGVVAGLGYGFNENFALEGEFIGAWFPINVSGTASTYSGIFGPRFSLPLSADGKFGVFAGAGIGVVHTEITLGPFWGSATRFGWQAKAGVQYEEADSFELFLDGRYVATAEYAGDGAVGIGLGIRFYPLN